MATGVARKRRHRLDRHHRDLPLAAHRCQRSARHSGRMPTLSYSRSARTLSPCTPSAAVRQPARPRTRRTPPAAAPGRDRCRDLRRRWPAGARPRRSPSSHTSQCAGAHRLAVQLGDQQQRGVELAVLDHLRSPHARTAAARCPHLGEGLLEQPVQRGGRRRRPAVAADGHARPAMRGGRRRRLQLDAQPPVAVAARVAVRRQQRGRLARFARAGAGAAPGRARAARRLDQLQQPRADAGAGVLRAPPAPAARPAARRRRRRSARPARPPRRRRPARSRARSTRSRADRRACSRGGRDPSTSRATTTASTAAASAGRGRLIRSDPCTGRSPTCAPARCRRPTPPA